jgi:hypothetical protein
MPTIHNPQSPVITPACHVPSYCWEGVQGLLHAGGLPLCATAGHVDEPTHCVSQEAAAVCSMCLPLTFCTAHLHTTPMHQNNRCMPSLVMCLRKVASRLQTRARQAGHQADDNPPTPEQHRPHRSNVLQGWGRCLMRGSQHPALSACSCQAAVGKANELWRRPAWGNWCCTPHPCLPKSSMTERSRTQSLASA